MAEVPQKSAPTIKIMFGCCLLMSGVLIFVTLLLATAAISLFFKPAAKSGHASASAASVQAIHLVYGVKGGGLHTFTPVYPVLDRDITLPFREPEQGCIALEALFGNVRQECLWDTGASSTMLPCFLDLHQLPTGLHAPSGWEASRTPFDSELVTLPQVQIGRYTLYNLPANALTTGRSHPVKRLDAAACRHVMQSVPLLGSPLFATSAVTIDRERHQLIVHARYDAEAQHRANPKSLLLNFDWDGYITIRGEIAGKPAKFMLDTGNVSHDVILSRAFQPGYFARLPGAKVKYEGGLGSAEGKAIPSVVCKMGPLVFQRRVVVTAEAGRDASIGLNLLPELRVTIDYPHQKILFEPHH